ncbi:MAG: hypothetical protein A2W68_05775 [Betaproteobacteria bacterium RIFCSPLOWO2_02_64_14]|nr:MAG: hypothetical protein A2W68_05775 [Betaproteobacteria bacterium RIFCSPLOWO2_02_64_14]
MKVDEFEFFLEKDWSDGFPVVTPTEERVQWMLTGTRRNSDEVVGNIPPAGELATVRTVAIHALMAGCKPEYLPVVLGGISLMLREELNLGGVQCTMHGVAPLMIVNGPYADKIGLRGGNGCFGPGFRANATIGRAIRLMLMNLGGGLAGIASATVFASPIRYTACLTEHVAQSPWESLAASRGHAPGANVITCAMVESPRLHFDDVSTEPERLLTGIGDAMTAPGSWNMWFNSDMVVAMSPQHAKLCAGSGMTRAKAVERLVDLAVRKQGQLRRGGNWRPERARAMGIDPDDDESLIRAVKDPQRLHLIVAGGLGPVTAVCHGWNESSHFVHGTYEV